MNVSFDDPRRLKLHLTGRKYT